MSARAASWFSLAFATPAESTKYHWSSVGNGPTNSTPDEFNISLMGPKPTATSPWITLSEAVVCTSLILRLQIIGDTKFYEHRIGSSAARALTIVAD